MNLLSNGNRRLWSVAIFWHLVTWATAYGAQSATPEATNEIRLVKVEGIVEASPSGATNWIQIQTNQRLYPHDRLRTGTNSRAALRWSDQSVVPIDALTELEILPPHSSGAQSGLHLLRGIISFFHREQPGRIRVITRGAAAGIEGTEFVLAATDARGREVTTLSVIDGRVQLANDRGTVVLTNGQQAQVAPGQAPTRTPGFVANNILQWCFYYPAVLDLEDLPLTQDEQAILGDSLAAYRAGDLLAALANYPSTRQPGSEAERVYRAVLLLSVGQVTDAETVLASLSAADPAGRPQRLAAALRQLVAAVKRQPEAAIVHPELATEFLASSYREQSHPDRRGSLESALNLARQAAAASPKSGFAWARVAELEFSFGHTRNALDALDRSLALSPRNAQALALKGFLLAARNQTRAAITWFDRALATDSALGNAWLGRGLCRIRLGHAAEGREDLLVAAALEPQRAELRSYLGKADANTGDYARASQELQLARRLDPEDPTAWLYSALLEQEHRRFNEAIRDLEESKRLNDNRSVYRSQLLLDEDRAVRAANLAAMYQDAGLSDVAVREAARAVNYDYGNYSAHLFLANSFSALRDPNLINLRYETPALNEYLLADLLAPVSAGALSPAVSQHEYSRMFERDRLGVVSTTEYLSRGAWTQSGAQFGTFGNFNYSFDAFYRSDPGQRVNEDIEERQLSLTTKYQFTPQDSVSLRVQHYEAESGDVAQYYDPGRANPNFRVREKQEPILALGYHHEWNPGVHTLFLATRLHDVLSFTNPAQPTLLTVRPDVDPESMPGVTELIAVHELTMHEQFENKLEIYTAELQQIWQQPGHNTIVGGRVQYGHFHTANLQVEPSAPFAGFFPEPPEPSAQQQISSLFRRFSFYGYHLWQIAGPLQLIGGLTCDWLKFPDNFRYAPLSTEEETVEQVSPKAGLIWTPGRDTTLRFAYSRAVSGASLDQSYQLEPSQMAGFVQSFRSIIPESVAGANAGARFETFGVSLEQKFDTGTYLGLSGELLNSDVRRTLGAFDVLPDRDFYAVPSGLRQRLDYQEQSLLFTVNQLVNKAWSLGARYRLSKAVLNENFVDVPDFLPFGSIQARQRLESVLQHVDLIAVYNHPSGYFFEGEAQWYTQSNAGYTPAEAGDDFWQVNLFAGYRFPRRKAEVSVGLLNLTDQDYRLAPLNLHDELPRKRTLALRLQLNF